MNECNMSKGPLKSQSFIVGEFNSRREQALEWEHKLSASPACRSSATH